MTTVFSGLLPAKLWHQVFRYLDGASLLAVAEAVPELQSVALHPKLLRSVTFLPDSNEATLETFFTAERRQHVRALRFTDCVALGSGLLLSCATICESLRELYIVNCAVDPTQLFEVLPQKLPHLQVLEWSLFEGRFYGSSIQDAARQLGTCPKLTLMHLRSMYVEVVATPRNLFLLELIFIRCPKLVNLHVHSIRKDIDGESSRALLAGLMHPRPDLKTFTYTSEYIPLPRKRGQDCLDRGGQVQRRFVPEGTVWRNIAYLRTPEAASCSFVYLSDLMEQKVSLRDVRQAIVAVEANTEVSCHLIAAASQAQLLDHVKSLTLVLYEPCEASLPKAPPAHRKYLGPLHMLFSDSCSAITELNMTSFHFTCGADVSCVIGSALRLLRELAITPCGINDFDSLTYLSRGCKFLEVLDVRTEQEPSTRSSCVPCRVPLWFTERSFEDLHTGTRLRRLSVDETATLSSLAFLRECKVRELRLYTGTNIYTGLGELLRTNLHLSVLTIEDHRLTLRCELLEAELGSVHTLRRLTVLSGRPTLDCVASSFANYLGLKLPLLEILHLHYPDVRQFIWTPTWIRQRPVVTTDMRHIRHRQSNGVVCYNKPCVGCYASTYIGLARPRNRN